ncbi:MAG: peptidoglycan-binding protein LysM, partial [Methylotenera sp.]
SDGLEAGHVLAINRFGKIIKDPEFDLEKYEAEKAARTSETEANTNPEKNSGMKLQPGLIKLPNERIGLVMIFRVFDKVAYGLVMQATEPINMLDAVQTP